jgi:hypothetical protein
VNTTPSHPPHLKLEITQENYERAITAKSSACVVADAIKQHYPRFSSIHVDVATIRVTDKQLGVRYTYLTPPSVAETLLYFDQGWREESLPKKLRIREVIRVTPITRTRSSLRMTAERRAVRLAELEAKEQGGEELSREEKVSLTKLRNPQVPPDRPTTYGPKAVEIIGDQVIQHGRPPKYPKRSESLLDDRTRHFGQKSAKPSAVLQKTIDEAVEAGIKADRAKRAKSK